MRPTMQNRPENICSSRDPSYEETSLRQDDIRLYKSKLTLRDLLRNSTISTRKVSQDDILPEGHPGACTGLSTIHIMRQLNSDKLIPHNPFEDTNQLNQAIALHETCRSETFCMIRHGIKNILTEQDKIIKKSKPSNLIAAFENSDPNKLEQKLLKAVNDTHHDGKSRGIYVIHDIPSPHHEPTNQDNQVSTHTLSMTIQRDNKTKEMFCTGMDSNAFFLWGQNKNDCEQIAGVLSALPNQIHQSTNAACFTITKKPSHE